ncbi:MAG TPA: MMPL family transporter [Pirellulales bacterium]
MFDALGQFIAHRWRLALLVWVAAAVLLTLVAPRWDDVTNDGDLAYLPARMTSVRGEHLLAAAFPDDAAKSQIVLAVAREDKPLSADDLAFLERLAARFPPDEHARVPVLAVWTPETDIVGRKLISRDQRAAIAILKLSTEFMAVRNADVLKAVTTVLAEERLSPARPAGLELGVTGSAAIGGDTMASAHESIQHTELTTIALVILILALVYRAPLLVLVPLLTIGVAVTLSMKLVALLTLVNHLPGFEWCHFQVFKTTKIFVVTILFGAGTDFCLFLVSRYREELARGLERPEALAHALGKVGHAITASAMTTIIGLGMMVAADFGKFRNSGPAIGLCLFVALLACMTLAPALLRLFGPAVFWPFGPRPTNEVGDNGQLRVDSRAGRFWNRLSYAIVARPGLILLASVLAMSTVIVASCREFPRPAADASWWKLPLPYIQISYNLLGDLDPQRPSIVGTRLVQRHFAPGELGPVTLVAYKPPPRLGQSPESDQQRQHLFNGDEGERDVARLTKLLYEMPGVDSVRSIAEPLGGVPGVFNPLSTGGRRKMAALKNPRTKANFLSQVPRFEGRVTRLDIVLTADPFSRAAAQSLGEIERRVLELRDDPESAWHETEFDFTGVTAGTRDLQAVTQSDETLIQRLVTLAVLGILIVVLRRPLICLYLIASVLFSYYVTIAATQLVFARVYPEFDGLDWKVPIFLFVILIAVGEDYNIFLVTRVLEEQRRWGLLEGLRRAVVSTGGIITSCGVIMAGTFISMMTGTLRGMLELGFALTLGVMLDTLIVRPVLVPAFLAILWRRAAAPLPDDRAAQADTRGHMENGTSANGASANGASGNGASNGVGSNAGAAIGKPHASELSGLGNR